MKSLIMSMPSFLILLFVFFIFSCTEKETLKIFVINEGDKITEISLFKDSTYVKDTRLLERKITLKGKWTGSIQDGNSFTLIEEKEEYKVNENSIIKQ